MKLNLEYDKYKHSNLNITFVFKTFKIEESWVILKTVRNLK